MSENDEMSTKGDSSSNEKKRSKLLQLPELDVVESNQHSTSLSSLKRFKSYAANTTAVNNKSEYSRSAEVKAANTEEKQPVKIQSVSGGLSNSVGSGSLLVNSRQRGNPLLKCIRSVPWEYCDNLIPDYQMSRTSCALFLSIRYHTLNPNYIHQRIAELRKQFDLRVLLVQVDVLDPQYALRELARLCLLADLTLIVCSSPEEAAQYLEAYKILEHKPADLLMSDHSDEGGTNRFLSNACDFLTGIKSVNNSDANMLLRTFGTLKDIIKANENELKLCPGIGSLKAARISRAFNMPFLKKPLNSKTLDSTDASKISN